MNSISLCITQLSSAFCRQEQRGVEASNHFSFYTTTQSLLRIRRLFALVLKELSYNASFQAQRLRKQDGFRTYLLGSYRPIELWNGVFKISLKNWTKTIAQVQDWESLSPFWNEEDWPGWIMTIFGIGCPGHLSNDVMWQIVTGTIKLAYYPHAEISLFPRKEPLRKSMSWQQEGPKHEAGKNAFVWRLTNWKQWMRRVHTSALLFPV